VHQAINILGFQTKFEPRKRHPRDQLTFGRTKVLFKVNGAPVNPYITTKRQLLIKVAELIPGVRDQMIQDDPNIKAHAAASRSEITSVLESLMPQTKKATKNKK
jgi:signal recognition particle subunit SEC65